MERQPVTSSHIISIGYDETTQTLEVEFTNEKTFQYFNVPKTVYDNFINSESKGRFFRLSIKSNFEFALM